MREKEEQAHALQCEQGDVRKHTHTSILLSMDSKKHKTQENTGHKDLYTTQKPARTNSNTYATSHVHESESTKSTKSTKRREEHKTKDASLHGRKCLAGDGREGHHNAEGWQHLDAWKGRYPCPGVP